MPPFGYHGYALLVEANGFSVLQARFEWSEDIEEGLGALLFERRVLRPHDAAE